MMKTSQVISLIASLIVLAVAVFLIIVGIKAGVDHTSFIDAWNAIFGNVANTTATPVDTGATTPVETPATGA